MASGKQTSFSYGEIDPQHRFKSGNISYQEGLARLKNGIVDSSGGVKNRAGFRYIATHSYQDKIPSEGQDPSLRVRHFKDLRNGTFDSGDSFRLLSYALPDLVAGPSQPDRHLSFMTRTGTFTNVGGTVYSNGGGSLYQRLIQLDDNLVLTFQGRPDNLVNEGLIYVAPAGASGYAQEYFTSKSAIGTPPATSTISGQGTAGYDIFPVTYLAMQETFDGYESAWNLISAEGQHPNAEWSTTYIFDIENDSQVKRYNVYRSAGTFNSALGLVGKVSITDTAQTNFRFEDFISVADFTRGPPINPRFWGDQTGFTTPEWFDTKRLRYVTCMDLYQQRLVFAPDSDTDENFEVGTVVVSKLGQWRMLHHPNVFDNINAFEFTIPVDKKGKIVAFLSMERLIVFTQKNTFVIRGGGQGILTPTTINPQVISFEGCSEYVEPVKTSNRGFFLNADHSKLMQIVFSIDGNLITGEVSEYSEHLLSEDIVEMAATSGGSDIVWLLKRNGKLVSITIGDANGFAEHETDGHIESICSGPERLRYGRYLSDEDNLEGFLSSKPMSDTIFISVIRDGVRFIESLTRRIDSDPKGYFFADSYVEFGTRLGLINGQHGSALEEFTGLRQAVTIIGGITWEAGEPVQLTTPNTLIGLDSTGFLDIYYDDDQGVEQTIRFKINSYDFDPVDGRSEADGYFLSDVPTQLQNASTRRWAVVFNQVTGLTHLANKEVSVFADGEVISSPNNPNKETLTVSAGGVLDLPDYYAYGIVGLPYTFEMETLDLESSDNRTLTSSRKLINAAGVAFERTLGGFIGTRDADISTMEEIAFSDEDSVEIPIEPFTDHIEVPVQGTWERSGRINIKQVDPLPMSVLAVYPKGIAGD